MNRLQSELQRLYLLPAAEGNDAAGPVRGLVMALSQPADWELLGRVWRGVQADLELPAPGIAVSGSDALQLWFSLQAPVSAARGADFLARLAGRYLGDVAPARLQLLPSAGAATHHAPRVPAQQPGTDNWSAFVSADLAPVFGDTPWLDIPPSAEGQADLLARLQPIEPAAFEAALQSLQPAMAAPTPAASMADVDPRRFLQQVLNDANAPLALRVEAAKTLLR